MDEVTYVPATQLECQSYLLPHHLICVVIMDNH